MFLGVHLRSLNVSSSWLSVQLCSRGLVEAAMGINLASRAIKASRRVQLRASINVNLKSLRRLRCRLIEYLLLTLAKHIFMMVWSLRHEVYVQFYFVHFYKMAA